MSDSALRLLRLLVRVGIAVVAVIEVVLALGVLLQALAANPEATFAEWAYGNQDVLMEPFENVFDDVTFGGGDNVLDLNGLLAMAVYACLLIPLGMLLGWVSRARAGVAAREREARESAMTARLLAGEPDQPRDERAGVGERLRSRFRRRPPDT